MAQKASEANLTLAIQECRVGVLSAIGESGATDLYWVQARRKAPLSRRASSLLLRFAAKNKENEWHAREHRGSLWNVRESMFGEPSLGRL